MSDTQGPILNHHAGLDALAAKAYVTCNALGVSDMASSTAKRVNQHRSNLRAAGLRPLQIWVPDTRRPGFAEECHQQSLLAAETDAADTELQTFLDDALADTDGWTA